MTLPPMASHAGSCGSNASIVSVRLSTVVIPAQSAARGEVSDVMTMLTMMTIVTHHDVTDLLAVGGVAEVPARHGRGDGLALVAHHPPLPRGVAEVARACERDDHVNSRLELLRVEEGDADGRRLDLAFAIWTKRNHYLGTKAHFPQRLCIENIFWGPETFSAVLNREELSRHRRSPRCSPRRHAPPCPGRRLGTPRGRCRPGRASWSEARSGAQLIEISHQRVSPRRHVPADPLSGLASASGSRHSLDNHGPPSAKPRTWSPHLLGWKMLSRTLSFTARAEKRRKGPSSASGSHTKAPQEDD